MQRSRTYPPPNRCWVWGKVWCSTIYIYIYFNLCLQPSITKATRVVWRFSEEEEHGSKGYKEMVPRWKVMALERARGGFVFPTNGMMSGFAASWVSSGLKCMQSVTNQVQGFRQMMCIFSGYFIVSLGKTEHSDLVKIGTGYRVMPRISLFKRLSVKC